MVTTPYEVEVYVPVYAPDSRSVNQRWSRQLRDVVARLANASLKRIEDLEEKSSALVDAQIKSEGKISALAEAQTH